MSKEEFVILDRDGVIIHERNYLADPELVELIPGAAIALRKFQELGLGLVVVTNQSGVGRGYFSLGTLEKIHNRLSQLLAVEGVVLDGIYFCPHHPDENCLCRKPKLGMFKKAVKKHKFDPKLSFVIGDKDVDIKFGKNAGATTILVRTGYGAEHEKFNHINPDHVVDDLGEAASLIKQKLNFFVRRGIVS